MKLTPIAYSLALAGLACSLNVHAASTSYWTGGGVDAELGTSTNWQGGVPTTSTDAMLIFDAVNVGTGSFAVNSNLSPAPVYNSLRFNSGDFNVSGQPITLRPTDANYYVLTNSAGANTISAPLNIATNSANRALNALPLDIARIFVGSGSLTLGGAISAGQINLSTYVAPTASLSMSDVSAKSFVADGGAQNLTGLLLTGSPLVSLGTQSTSTKFTVSGAGGAIRSAAGNGGKLVLGSQSSTYSGVVYKEATLILDNTSVAKSDRLDSDVAVTMSSGSTLLLKGHATTDVDQNAGALTVNGSNSGLTHIKVEGAGANASLVFGSLTSSGLVNFASSGVLGGKESIKFNTIVPALTDSLMSKAVVNGREFASYDAAKGVVAATNATSLVGALSTHNVYVSAGETLSGGTTAINSLAVNNAAITEDGAHAISLASGKLLTSGTVSISPSISFGTKAGEITNLGNTVLAGGVNGSNGLNVLGNGSLTLAKAGSLTGAVAHLGQLVLSADNALQGASVTSYGLDVGATTQNFNSFTGGTSNNSNYYESRITGTGIAGSGRIVAANDISLNQNVVDVSLEGKNVSIRYGLGNYSNRTINGNIQASQNIDLSESYGTVVNGVISGAAKVAVNGATFANQNTYTGATTGSLTLSGNGAIATSSGYSNGYLTMRATDGDNGALNRVGDVATVSAYRLQMLGSGSVNMSETIGTLSVSGATRLEMTNGTGTTTLSAGALSLASGSSLVLALGDKSNFKVITTPGIYTGGSNVVKDVYIEKSIGGRFLPTWAAYDAGDGGRFYEAVVGEQSLNSANSDAFVRVTDATNQALTADRTVGAVNIDTNQAMGGSKTLTVASGQVLFWKDNTINMAGLNFGAQQGVVTNAGTNAISSVISGSKGLVKMGEGTLVLTANSATTLTGVTQVGQGALSITSGGQIGDVSVGYSSQLNLSGTGTAKITDNYGTVNLNRSYANSAGQSIGGGGTINVNAGLSNQGSIYGQVVNTSSVSNSGSGYISSVEHNSGSFYNAAAASIGNLTQNSATSITNNGQVGSLTVYSGAGSVYNAGTVSSLSNYGTVTNAGTVSYLDNYGTVVNTGTVGGLNGSLYNSGTFTNSSTGTLILDYSSLGGAVINRGTATQNQGSHTSGDGYEQAAGTTTINGEFHGNMLVSGGVLKGSGAIYGNLTVTGGQVKPGNSPGLLTVNGDVVLEMGSVLNMEVGYANGALTYDQLVVSGTFTNNGTIKLDLGSGVNFSSTGVVTSTNGQSVTLAGMFSENLLSSLVGSKLWVASTDAAGTTTNTGFVIAENMELQSVPVPGAAWLLGSGLLGLIGVARRKALAA